MSLLWTLLFVVAAGILALAVKVMLRGAAGAGTTVDAPRTSFDRTVYPYQRHETLLSPGERAFFRVLRTAVSPDVYVACKVRLCDVILCTPESRGSAHRNRIQQKHVDFVLMDADSTSILAVIELDDASHQRKSRLERDDFLNSALAAAELPILRVPAASAYSCEALRQRLLPVLGRVAPTAVPMAKRVR